MSLTKPEIAFLFLSLIIIFAFYLGYRSGVYSKIRDQEKVYKELWEKYYENGKKYIKKHKKRAGSSVW